MTQRLFISIISAIILIAAMVLINAPANVGANTTLLGHEHVSNFETLDELVIFHHANATDMDRLLTMTHAQSPLQEQMLAVWRDANHLFTLSNQLRSSFNEPLFASGMFDALAIDDIALRSTNDQAAQGRLTFMNGSTQDVTYILVDSHWFIDASTFEIQFGESPAEQYARIAAMQAIASDSRAATASVQQAIDNGALKNIDAAREVFQQMFFQTLSQRQQPSD